MRRRTFDSLVSLSALVVAGVVLTASGLLFWAHSFVDDNVRTQLAAQKIFFPPEGSPALEDPAVKEFLTPYAGQQMLDGRQAQVYADHFIAVHLAESTGGRSYAELSTASRANPADAELKGLVETSFRGETLRGLLLNAYGFWKLGEIALTAAWVSLVAGLVLVLTALTGLRHARRTPVDQVITLPGDVPASGGRSATSPLSTP